MLLDHELATQGLGTTSCPRSDDREPTINLPDLRALAELALAIFRCDGALISTLNHGHHHIFVSKGDGAALVPSVADYVAQVLRTGERLVCPSGSGESGALFIGLPLWVGGTQVVGVLSIVDSKRANLSAADEGTLANFQIIVNAMLASHDAHRQAAERQAELQVTLEHMNQGITVFDADARLTLWNQRYIEIFNIDPLQVYKGARLRDLVASKRVEERGFNGFETNDFDTMLAKLRGGLARGEIVEGGVELENGRIITSIHAPMPDGGWVATHSDITDRVQAQEKVKHASLHDPLTGLVNRAKFNSAFEESSQGGGRVAIMLVDIDYFKAVNDNFGHGAGDAVIKTVAERLRSCVRSTDVVARLGGDEFAVLLHLDAAAPHEPAQKIAESVVNRMREELSFQGTLITFSVSVGCHEMEAGQSDLETMLTCADFALYKAKENGRSRHQFFDGCVANQLDRAKRIHELVHPDTYAQKLTLQYQPLVCLETGRDYGFEALIRWAGARQDHIAPIDIIQAAEKNGSIRSLGPWILNQVLSDFKSCNAQIRLAINISTRQLGHGELVSHVENALGRWGVSADRLELEVTETALLNDQASIDELHQIKALGVRIALDDFGTGYSSLTLLQRFPFDKLKIDRSFVNSADTNSLSHAIVRSVTQLGRDLEMKTVAEGIETERHLEVMRSLGCTLGQGHLLGRPMSAQDAAARAMVNGLCASVRAA